LHFRSFLAIPIRFFSTSKVLHLHYQHHLQFHFKLIMMPIFHISIIGGGACWDETSTKAGFCTSDSSPQSPVGVFDRTNAKNAYKDYTIVHVLYCSGDIHGGNVVRDYDDNNGVPVTQRGWLTLTHIISHHIQQHYSCTVYIYTQISVIHMQLAYLHFIHRI
jgi:hypothetical protein